MRIPLFYINKRVLIEKHTETDVNHLLAYHLLLARRNAQMTQKELAEGLGMELRIDFMSK